MHSAEAAAGLQELHQRVSRLLRGAQEYLEGLKGSDLPDEKIQPVRSALNTIEQQLRNGCNQVLTAIRSSRPGVPPGAKSVQTDAILESISEGVFTVDMECELIHSTGRPRRSRGYLERKPSESFAPKCFVPVCARPNVRSGEP